MTQKLKRPFTATARRKSAIAPGWEVQTAKLQDANGLSNAGLSELERSANLGRTTGKPIAQTINGISTLEDWNPIGMDFGGGLATTQLSTSNVQFNADGAAELDARLNGTASTQYFHKTSWLNNTDGYLVLDKNINGSLDNGEELFSNSAVAEQYRGVASLATWDADGNGVINANDPLFDNLLVWRADHYKNRSCLRPNLLGYGTKTHLKIGKNFARPAFNKAINTKLAQKRSDFGSKSSQNRLFVGTSSYELNSIMLTVAL